MKKILIILLCVISLNVIAQKQWFGNNKSISKTNLVGWWKSGFNATYHSLPALTDLSGHNHPAMTGTMMNTNDGIQLSVNNKTTIKAFDNSWNWYSSYNDTGILVRPADMGVISNQVFSKDNGT